MSVESMAIALNHSRATGAAKVILIGIANHEGEGGAWPSIGKLAHYANTSARGAQKAIQRLIELGEVRVQIQGGGTHRTPDHSRPNRYEITLRCPADCDRSAQHRTSQPLAQLDPLNPSSPPEPQFTPPLNPSSPEPPINHPSNKDLKKTNVTNARASVLPAPKYPKFTPEPPRQQPRPRSAAEAAQIAELEQQPCPAASNFTHWFPGDLTECARGCKTTLTEMETTP